MTCSICNNKNKLQIDRMLVQGISHQKIAKQFGVDSQAVWRHAQNHLSHQLVTAYEKKELAESMDLLGRIEQIISRAEKIFRRNYAKNSTTGDNLALKSISEQRQTFELLAKIAAFLHESRAMELQLQEQQQADQSREETTEYINEVLDILTEPEADVWEVLVKRINGEINDPLFEYVTSWKGTIKPVYPKWIEDDKPAKTPSEPSEESTPTLDIDPSEKMDSQTDLPHSAEVEKDSQTMRRTKYPKKYRVQETKPDSVKVYPRSDDLSPPFEYGASKRPAQLHKEAVPFSVDKGLRIKDHEVRND